MSDRACGLQGPAARKASRIAVLLVWGLALAGRTVPFAAGAALPHTSVAADTPAPAPPPHMTVIPRKDVSGTVYKKLGLPDRHFCWDTCLKETRCSGVRWGSVAGDTAGLCLLMTGPLTLKDLVEPRTEDGKAIHVTVARKDGGPSGGGT